jgi:hypothetical protein
MNDFRVKAIGWSVEVTGHRLSKDEYQFVKKWCSTNDYDSEGIPGNLEGTLADYNAYHTNSWQTGCVLMLDLNRFFLTDKKGTQLIPITAPLIKSSEVKLKRVKALDMKHDLKPRYNKLLVYFEESKGVGAAWKLKLKNKPVLEDFTILYSKFSLGLESFYYICDLQYQGVSLERDYDCEDLSGKASYSKLF